MSKSLGNFFTVHDLLGGHDGQPPVAGEVIRFVFLGTHYRKPMDWTEKKRAEAEATLRKWWSDFAEVEPAAEPDRKFVDLLADDLNTPGAIARLHELAAAGEGEKLVASAELLGVRFIQPKLVDEPAMQVLNQVMRIVQERRLAREAKDYDRADFLRKSLEAAGVRLTDTPDGAEWTFESGFDAAKLEGL